MGHHPVPRSTTLYPIQFATQLSEEMTTFEGGPLQALFITSVQHIWLVVEPTPLKNMKVSWDDSSQYMGK